MCVGVYVCESVFFLHVSTWHPTYDRIIWVLPDSFFVCVYFIPLFVVQKFPFIFRLKVTFIAIYNLLHHFYADFYSSRQFAFFMIIIMISFLLRWCPLCFHFATHTIYLYVSCVFLLWLLLWCSDISWAFSALTSLCRRFVYHTFLFFSHIINTIIKV